MVPHKAGVSVSAKKPENAIDTAITMENWR